MGMVRANIQLLNGDDVSDARRGRIGEDEIRQLEINMLVDTGAAMLALNEEIREVLGLPIIDIRPSQMADGLWLELPVIGPVKTVFEGRFSTCNALVLPGDSEPLLGAIPMEEMDVWINPTRNQLAFAHPEGQVMALHGVR